MPPSNSVRRAAVEPFIARYSEVESKKKISDFLQRDLLTFDATDSLEYQKGAIWEEAVSRALSRKSHGWFFLRYWYAAWSHLSVLEKSEIERSLKEMLATWNGIKNDSSMAFHDETTAQRLINFSVFLDETKNDLSDNLVGDIRQLIQAEIELLATDGFYAGLNNHGMFQDIALLTSTALGFGGEESERSCNKAVTRLHHYFLNSFGRDGIHRENSPTYHLMVSRYLSDVQRYLKLMSESSFVKEIQPILDKADYYGAFALTPGGAFTPISDTRKNKVSEASVSATFGSGAMVGVLTQGAEGELPKARTFVSEESGYGIYRSDWSENANYIFFSAAYNADYHKHSDELSIYYYAHGRELLAESGPNGYEYSDPFTRYAFSSAAHNTLLVDGTGLPRTDEKADQTTLFDQGSSIDSLNVLGKTKRFEDVHWKRRVEVPADTKGALVNITDRVSADEERSLTFLWHLGAGLEAVVRGNAVEIFDPETDLKLGELTWSGSAPVGVRLVKGQTHPYYQGWSFPTMGKHLPAGVIEVEYRGREVSVDWEMRSSDFKLVDRGISPGSQWRTHFAEKPINYLLEGVNREGKANQLLVAFTAMGQLNDFTYNYRASLQGFPGAILYILDDFGDQGSYYLASGRNLAEFRSVQSLIRTVTSSMGLSLSDVVTLGSSKGATAALLHGATLGVHQVYAGAPQYKIGNFVKKPHPNVLRYISGDETEGSVSWANDIAFRILSSGVRSTKISVLVGKRDGHHRHHCVPLIDDLRMLGYQPENLVLPGTTHAQFGAVFRKFLISLVEGEKKGGKLQFPTSISYDAESSRVGLILSGGENMVIQAQLYKNGKASGPLQRVTRGISGWTVTEKGTYRARIYFDRPDTGERTAFGSAAVEVK